MTNPYLVLLALFLISFVYAAPKSFGSMKSVKPYKSSTPKPLKIKIKHKSSSSSSHASSTSESQANTLANDLVFCGLQGSLTRGQESVFYYRFKRVPFAVQWDAIQPQVGLKPITADQTSPPLILEKDKDYFIKKAEKGFMDASTTGLFQSLFIGYGCVNGKPSDIGEWYEIKIKPPMNVQPGVYGVYFQLGYQYGGEALAQSQFVPAPTAVSIN